MRRLADALLWAGCAAALLGATQPWWAAGERTTVSGSQASGGAALALVLAAAAGGFLGGWLRPVARRIVLGIVAVLAVGGIVVAAGARAPSLPGSTLGDALTLVATPWRWIYLAGTVLIAAGAVLAQLAGPRPTRAASTPDPAMDAWKALDAGEDPTLEQGRGVGGDPQAEPTE